MDQENRNVLSEQSMLNTVSLKKAFIPRIEALTTAIHESSSSSGKLTKAIIALTFIGLVLVVVEIVLSLDLSVNPESLTDSQLECIVKLSEGRPDSAMKYVQELCLDLP